MVTWDVLEGTVRGAAHVQRGTPNQDAVASLVLADGFAAIAAVSDGHGGERYVRSDLGSRFAVDIACDIVRQWWERQSDGGRSARMERDFRDAVVPEITRQWRARVSEHFAANSFTDEERERAGAPLDMQPLIAYGATLLVALASDRALALAQLGDGDIVLVRGDDVQLPIEPDERLVASQTTSLCLDTAEADFRCAIVRELDDLDLVLLSTDGYANSFADDDWERAVGRDLASRVTELGIDNVKLQLPAWLGESAVASGDDTSVALLVPAAGESARVSAQARAGASAAGGGARRVIGIAAAALVLGLGAGWLGGNATADPLSPPPRQDPATTRAVVGGSAERHSVITAAPGIAVRFTPDPLRPQPVLVHTAAAGATTRLRLAGGTWEVGADGELLVSVFSSPTPVPVGITVGAISATDRTVWAIDAAGHVLVPVDAVTHQVFPAASVRGIADPANRDTTTSIPNPTGG